MRSGNGWAVRHAYRLALGTSYASAALLAVLLVSVGPARLGEIHIYDIPYYLIVGAHVVWAIAVLLTPERFARKRVSRSLFVPEILFAVSALFFLFSYIYAANAEMDYVERFIESGGELRMVFDTTEERLLALTRFAPFLLVNVFWYLFMRVRRGRLVRRAWPVAVLHPRGERGTVGQGEAAAADTEDRHADMATARATGADSALAKGVNATRRLAPWSMVLAVGAAALVTLSFPSFAVLEGIPVFAWFGLVPLLVAFRINRFGRAVFYGVFFGTALTLVSNFWLGTFNLLSLQFATILFFVYYLIFTPVAVGALKFVRRGAFLVLPAAWTMFELARSSGFLGYPWTLLGHSQYGQTALIQVSAIAGVWAVTFLVVLVNSGLAEGIWARLSGQSWRRASRVPFGAVATVLVITLVGWAVTVRAGDPAGRSIAAGGLKQVDDTEELVEERDADQLGDSSGVLEVDAQGAPIVAGAFGEELPLGTDPEEVAWHSGAEGESVPAGNAGDADGVRYARVALIQQNSDPRKAEYRRTYRTLRDLTNRSLAYEPDAVAWSETAFVPNIRRWSEDDSIMMYHRLVNELLEYQSDIGTWLLTGNDDYEIIRDEEGEEIERHNFNAAVFFSDRGERVETYHKIRLVPFTEHFPYQDIFPGIYALLQDFDVHFWEEGDERTVFEHPRFTFATPICFEDVFPNETRKFVTAGAEVILNITNDYWSLTEVQAKQHYAGGMFRAVENRRPLLRSTASGLTSYVDPYGRPIQTLPYYQEAFGVVDLAIEEKQPTTPYTRFGDWFVGASAVLLVGLAGGEGVRRRRSS